MSKSGFFWNDKKELILADCGAEIFRNTSSKPIMTEVSKKLNEVIGSQRDEINRAHQEDEQLRRDQQLIHEQLLEQHRELREAHEKSFNEMEESKRFQGFTFDKFSRKKLIENRDTILELTATIQELKYEVVDNLRFHHLFKILAEC